MVRTGLEESLKQRRVFEECWKIVEYPSEVLENLR